MTSAVRIPEVRLRQNLIGLNSVCDAPGDSDVIQTPNKKIVINLLLLIDKYMSTHCV